MVENKSEVFKTYEKPSEWIWIGDAYVTRLFVALNLIANTETGMIITTTKRLSKITGLSEKIVELFLDRLVYYGQIANISRSNSDYTIIKINNFARSQGGGEGEQ